jgi:hypothetical protein
MARAAEPAAAQRQSGVWRDCLACTQRTQAVASPPQPAQPPPRCTVCAGGSQQHVEGQASCSCGAPDHLRFSGSSVPKMDRLGVRMSSPPAQHCRSLRSNAVTPTGRPLVVRRSSASALAGQQLPAAAGLSLGVRCLPRPHRVSGGGRTGEGGGTLGAGSMCSKGGQAGHSQQGAWEGRKNSTQPEESCPAAAGGPEAWWRPGARRGAGGRGGLGVLGGRMYLVQHYQGWSPTQRQ